MSPRQIARALVAFGVVATSVIVVATVMIVKRRGLSPMLKDTVAVVPGALLHAHNFRWTEMKGDQSQWELSASDASYSDKKDSLMVKQARVTMVTNDGKEVRLDAPLATLRLSGSHVTEADLSGGLKITYNGFKLSTESATFLPDQDLITAPGPVTIEGNGVEVKGVGLDGHPKAQVFALKDKVDTHIVPEPGRGVPKQL